MFPKFQYLKNQKSAASTPVQAQLPQQQSSTPSNGQSVLVGAYTLPPTTLLPSRYQQSVLKTENSDLSASTPVKAQQQKQSRAPSTGQSKFYKKKVFTIQLVNAKKYFR